LAQHAGTLATTVSNIEDVVALQQLVARFANSFDTKDWAGLERCLKAELHTDYSDLRGTPAERMSSARFVELRRSALHDVQTHHLSGNIEVDVKGAAGEVKVSMAIFRRSATGETLNTHCLYVFGVERVDDNWLIGSIVQKVFTNDGQTSIHRGILKP
jgi:hypothetical protein